ncbi:hypothetical protein KIH74_35595, partial [Kineosporia sp. J2-2]
SSAASAEGLTKNRTTVALRTSLKAMLANLPGEVQDFLRDNRQAVRTEFVRMVREQSRNIDASILTRGLRGASSRVSIGDYLDNALLSTAVHIDQYEAMGVRTYFTTMDTNRGRWAAVAAVGEIRRYGDDYVDLAGFEDDWNEIAGFVTSAQRNTDTSLATMPAPAAPPVSAAYSSSSSAYPAYSSSSAYSSLDAQMSSLSMDPEPNLSRGNRVSYFEDSYASSYPVDTSQYPARSYQSPAPAPSSDVYDNGIWWRPSPTGGWQMWSDRSQAWVSTHYSPSFASSSSSYYAGMAMVSMSVPSAVREALANTPATPSVLETVVTHWLAELPALKALAPQAEWSGLEGLLRWLDGQPQVPGTARLNLENLFASYDQVREQTIVPAPNTEHGAPGLESPLPPLAHLLRVAVSVPSSSVEPVRADAIVASPRHLSVFPRHLPASVTDLGPVPSGAFLDGLPVGAPAVLSHATLLERADAILARATAEAGVVECLIVLEALGASLYPRGVAAAGPVDDLALAGSGARSRFGAGPGWVAAGSWDAVEQRLAEA